jgi:hypothetical protein
MIDSKQFENFMARTTKLKQERDNLLIEIGYRDGQIDILQELATEAQENARKEKNYSKVKTSDSKEVSKAKSVD